LVLICEDRKWASVLLDIRDPGWIGVQRSCGPGQGNMAPHSFVRELLAFGSSCVHDLGSCHRFVYFTGDGSLETPEHILLRLALTQSALDVGLGARVMTHANQRDPMQRRVSSAITTMVDPVAIRLA